MSSPKAADWIMNKAFPWPARDVTVDKIDTHHHWVPSNYAKAVADSGGDPSGWPTPQWSISGTEILMQRMGIRTAILSITAPGPCILKDKKASWELARDLNEQAAKIRDAAPQKFGFFLTLGDIHDTDATLSEIRYGLDTLHADGVTLFTRYGKGSNYLGHKAFDPIWKELDKRKAVVFIHPTHPEDTDKINPSLPQPMVDYPHETTRTAVDMLSSGVPARFKNCKVVLSHAGGTLPYIIGRIATPLRMTNKHVSHATTGLSYDSVISGFRWFYYDLALSATEAVVQSLMSQVPHDHILFGSDYPYAPPPAYPAFLSSIEGLEMTQEQRDRINYGNGRLLFPRLNESTRL